MIISKTNKLYIIYLFIVGWFIILLHVYLRFLKPKESASLALLKDNITPFGYVLILNFLLIHLTILISIAYHFYKQYYKIERSSKIIAYISKIVDILYWKPLEYIHDLLAPDLPYSGTIIINITEYMEKGNQELRYKIYRHSYIFFEYLPQILCSVIFFIDIVILNQIYYFLYSIGFLLIPIIYKIYIKLCTSFVQRNEPDLLKVLDIKPQGEPNEKGHYINLFSMKSIYVSNKKILQEYTDNYILLQRITRHMRVIKKNSAKYYPYMILFTSGFYLSAAGFRLLYILF